MTGVAACIPTLGLSPLLDDLVYDLTLQDVFVRVYFNGEHVTESVLQLVEGWPLDDELELVHMPGASIYHEWNDAAQWACDRDEYLLVLNDDIVIPKGFATSLHDALEGHPEYGLIGVSEAQPCNQPPYHVNPCSHPAGNRYSFSAWCFIARPEAWQFIDPGYRVWYGDDDLIWKVNAAGWMTGSLHGVGVEHHTSTTTRQVPGAMAAAHEDGLLWARTHP